MTAKEYLKQAYRLNERIDAHIRELEELRNMSTRIQGASYEEHFSGTRNTDAPFVKLIGKIMDMEVRINSEIGCLMDLKVEMDKAIEKVEDIEEQLLLRYRYIDNMTWDDIANRLCVSSRTVHRIHSAALQRFVVPKESWHTLP